MAIQCNAVDSRLHLAIMDESKSGAKITANETNPSFFHDFFGRSSSAGTVRATARDDVSPAISVASDLGSEKYTTNFLEGIPFYGPGAGSDVSGSEITSRSAGNKRSLSDSVFMGSSRDGFQHIRPESPEGLHLKKILRNADADQPRGAHNVNMFFATNPLRTSSTPHLLGSPSGSGPKWDRTIPLHVGPTLQHTMPRVGKNSPLGIYTPTNRFRGGNVGPSGLSQSAADEGSRTGIKGSGVLSSIGGGMGVFDRIPSGVVLGGNRKSFGKPNSEPESSASASRQGSTSGNCQMTIFYGGQAHVFDDVHPEKADVIMALAGSNGGSWSTNYAKSASPTTSESFKAKEASVTSKHETPGELRRSLSIAGGLNMNVKQGGNAGETGAVQKREV